MTILGWLLITPLVWIAITIILDKWFEHIIKLSDTKPKAESTEVAMFFGLVVVATLWGIGILTGVIHL